MSKDFDTTFTDALDLAAAGAQTAGAPAARIRGRQRSTRKWMAVTGMSVVLVSGGGGAAIAAALSHHGGASAQPAAASATAPAVGPSESASSYSGPLDSLLLPVPAGAASLTPRQGVSGGAITADQYVANDYPGDGALQKTATEQTLASFGFESAAVRWYRDARGDDVEIYLVRFSGAGGAQGYGLSLASSRLQNGGATEFADPTAATGYGFTIPAAGTYTEADLFGYSGDIVVIVHVFATNGGGPAAATSIFASQDSAVRSAQR